MVRNERMKTWFPRAVALLLSLILTFSLSVPALAEETAPAASPVASDSVNAQTENAAGEQTAAEPTPAQSQDKGTGIIDAEALNAWAESFMQQHNLNDDYKDFSIGFCYTGTGDCWYWNADVWMYSASMYKVPVAMLLAEKEAAGELTPKSVINGTTLEYLESTALVYSNNDSGHSMVSYLGGTYNGKCTDQIIKYTDLPQDYFSQDFFDVSYYTAKFMTQVMKALYYGGADHFPHIVDYLLEAQPGAYFRSDAELSAKYPIAQKFGAFEEQNSRNNNHCAAIIYTPTPIVVVVMTRNVGDYQKLIAEVGAYLADYSLELDGKVAELIRQAAEQAAEERARAEEAAAAQSELSETAETAPAGTAEGMTEIGMASETPVISSSVEPKASGLKLPLGLLIAIIVVVVAIVAAVAVLLIRRSRKEDPDEDNWESNVDGDDDVKKPDETETLEEPLRKTQRSGSYRPRH